MKTYRSTHPAWTWLFSIVFLCVAGIQSTEIRAAESGKSGFATSDNFTVLAPPQGTVQEANAYATEVLEAAETLRSEIAQEWLGQELRRRQGRTIVTVSFERHRDAGLTWAIDDPRRNYHNLYLSTSPQQAMGSTLAHEMVHIVLATAFPHPNRLPTWLEEGIASRYDDVGRQRQRQQLIETFAKKGRWPSIADVMAATTMHAADRQAYTVAASITSLLLARDDDRQKLLQFGQYGGTHGWDAALQEFYGIAGVDQLQAMWQHWALD